MRLCNLLDDFIQELYGGKQNETPGAYRKKVAQFVRFVADRDPATLTVADLCGFKFHLLARRQKRRGGQIVEGRLSPNTVDSILRAVRPFLRWMHRRGYLTEDITRDFKIPRPPSPNPKAISAATFDKLLRLAATTGPMRERARNLALLYLLRDTGARAGALARIEISNVDLKRGRILVHEKGDHRYMLHLTAPTIAAVREWMKWRSRYHPRDDLLFTGQRGNGMTRVGLHQVLRRLAERGGIRERHNAHSFRHGLAREMLINGADMSTVQRTLGHASPATTILYYGAWEDDEVHAAHARYSPGKDIPVLKPQMDDDQAGDS